MVGMLGLGVYLIIESDDPDRQYLKTLLKMISKWFDESRQDLTDPTPQDSERSLGVIIQKISNLTIQKTYSG